jgi:hypothetical protein
MAMDRLRYFTGLFLEEPDFTTEQTYHLTLRRMMNFGVFTPGVLFGLTVNRVATNRVRVDPGMAVDRNVAASQGREVVLTAARIVDLSGFANGSQVYIALSYNEQPSAPKPPLNIESRISEEPQVVPVLDTGSGFTLDKNLNMILGKVRVGDLSVPDITERQLASLLLAGGGVGGAQAPTIASLVFLIPPRQGAPNVTMTIFGTNLGNNPAVTVLDTLSNPDPQITATINAGASTNTNLVVNLAISATAAVGNRLVRVQTDGGTVVTIPTGATAFTVLPPFPTITSINPVFGRQTVSVPVTIIGTNLGGGTAMTVLMNDTSADPNTTVILGAVTAGGTNLSATINVGAAAAPGGRIIRITTNGGSVDSPASFFTVRPAPVIKSLVPASQGLGQTFQIRGSDIRDPNLAVNTPATGTVVRFVDPGNPGNFVTAATGTVRADIAVALGPQVVEIVVPARGTVPVNANVTLQIENATAVSPVQFNFFGQ